MSRRASGLALAFATAVISGIAIFVNGHAVTHFTNATVYTTAKNGVAGILLILLALTTQRPGAAAPPLRSRPALLAVAVVGGSVPFVLFFEGLARAEATQAAFIQKTLVIWVVLLAVPLLKESIGWLQVVAIALLVVGQAWLLGSAGTVAFGSGEIMILGATLLWAVEVVLVKHLLASLPVRMLAAVRMGLGTLLLVAWLAISGTLGDLGGFDAGQWRWILLSGLLLAAYVATWFAALSRAPAVDVTAVLVFGAVVTAVLSNAADGAAISVAGVILITLGAALVAANALPQRRRAAAGAQA